ncbi:MAG: macrolide ABC transporter ATP-binding protein [Zetaproteobacteria bacterium CG12_big_fil_rev_8_21_14_0_65_55_1124]|nr:MAG: macrolide ABC transporter ATP-binding protein [Zetaproteobacteria bacterium CG1_02_55_237]PIS18464.1 MAG: macrolide ABC transporter ATP-binding protein [Zetaproteobacteria bacterium CG08_land_8_20_14_0_20_55_17]PIW42222.1 MAG: macrolide ABC transporter ATP-binding protein [Zetaproteobacteria bacterium CG12_big_fil_rev_8_21_14_0_65_55_1124]PIY53791.1 MAG: macrolide ABC transporter ATP-binding protein [Zetaproteobacteria bacterium CG_4_10_14_0_8_um_filter_55_43]PIZ38484.1 MAG: macrolide A
MALLTLQDIGKCYRQGEVEVQALTGIDLVLEEGEFTALVGPSGSGKTTLLNIIGGLDAPSSGHVHLNSTDLTNLNEAALSDFRLFQLGFIFQAYNLVPVLSALENVELIMVLQGRPLQERRERAEHYLALVGLKELMQRRPAALSGGQQQRVAVARALAAGPRLVLADEPTANLDSENAAALLDIMHSLSHEEKTTFIFSTHDPRVMDRAERIITLHDGSIIGDKRN